MDYKNMAEAALDERARLIAEFRSVNGDATLTAADKQERSERLEKAMAEKLAEVESLVTRGEREAEAVALATRSSGLFSVSGGRSEVREGIPLAATTRLAPAPTAADTEGFGEFLRSIACGEYRAQSEGTDAKGGFIVPTTYGSQVIDLARNKCRVMQAGAQMVPVFSDDLRVAKVVSDPAPGWRSESSAVAYDDVTLAEVQFKPKTLAVMVKASYELVEDASNLGAVLSQSLSGAFATKVDYAALYGSGVSPEPLGIKNTPGVAVNPVTANGGPIQWSNIAAAAQSVRSANYDNPSVLLSDRTENLLSQRIGSDGQYIGANSYLAGTPRYCTSQIPNNLAVGTSGAVTSDVFVGDFSMLGIGIRTSFQIRPLRERFADTGEYGFLAWMRADIQVFRTNAFSVITGATAA